MTSFLLALLLCASSPGDTPGNLRAKLAELNAKDPVSGTVHYALRKESGDEKKPDVTEGSVSIGVEAGPQGLRIAWPRSVLAAAAAEAKAKAANAESKTPIRAAMEELSAVDVGDYLDGAPRLLRELERTSVIEERTESVQGQPAQLLVLKLTPNLSAEDSKYVKDISATLKVWVAPDGLPLACEKEVRIKGRAFVVIGFESYEKETLRFAKIGDRLVVVHLSKESSGSGGGEHGRGTVEMSLTPSSEAGR
jgi:hypothetical protein